MRVRTAAMVMGIIGGVYGMIFANIFGIVPAALFIVGAILGAIGKYQS